MMYGIMYGIMREKKKTTIYLPEDLKKEIERVAQRENVSEANIIREAVANAMSLRRAPAPRIPLGDFKLGAPDIATRVDELLDKGFGR